jgi:hypothetical protein
MPFLVTATGPYGVLWLSKPSDIGLRTLVKRDQADLFPTVEEAERAISQMPKGYKLARVSFAIELSAELGTRPVRPSHSVESPDPHDC